MKLIFAGTPEFAAIALAALLDAGYDVVLTRREDARAAIAPKGFTPAYWDLQARADIANAPKERGWEVVAHNYEQGELLSDYAKDPKARALFEFMFLPLEAGRPVAAPPQVPADRLAALRRAFEMAAADPEFKDELAKQSASVELLKGEEIKTIVDKLYATPEDVLTRAKALLKAE